MISFNCRRGNVLFSENTACVQCQVEVGYESSNNSMVTLEPGRNIKRCQNGQQYNVWQLGRIRGRPIGFFEHAW